MRILSIQSHVSSGYVGNRAATFPLQLLGNDVDVINTVQLSNHTGYGHASGHKTSPDDLQKVFDGLRTNGIDEYEGVLTGYIPGAEALKTVRANIQRLKPPVYLLDPVMGDIGTGLYVSPDVIPVYRSMLGDATIITPNHFELELLSGVKISSLEDVKTALSTLHTQHTLQHIAVSSIILPRASLPALPPFPSTYPGIPADDSDILVCFASSGGQLWAYALPTIEGYYSGVGDLFSALVLAFHGDDFSKSVGRALHVVQMVLLKTSLTAGKDMRSRELRLVQEQPHILAEHIWPAKLL